MGAAKAGQEILRERGPDTVNTSNSAAGTMGIRLRVWYRFVVFLVFFTLVPLGIGIFLFRYGATLEEERRRQNAEDQLERTIGAVVRSLNPHEVVQGRFARFRLALQRATWNPAALPRLAKKARARWGHSCEPFLFDAAGRLVTPVEVPVQHRFVMQKLWDILTLPQAASQQEAARQRKKILALFGTTFRLGVVRETPGTVILSRWKGRDIAVRWDPVAPGSRAGLLLVSYDPPTRRSLLVRRARDLQHRALLTLVQDENGKVRSVLPRFSRDLLAGVRRQLEQAPSAKLSSAGYLWARAALDNVFLYLGTPLPESSVARVRDRVTGLCLALALVLGFVWYRVLFHDLAPTVSLRWKLVALFLLTLFIPMMSAGFLAFRTLRDRREVLVSRVLRAAKEAVYQLDHEFAADPQEFARRCRSLRDLAWRDPGVRQVLPQAVLARDHKKILHLELRSLRGELLGRISTPGFFDDLDHFMDTFGKTCITRELAGRLQQEGVAVIRPPDPASQEMLQSPQIGFTHIFQRRDVTHRIQLGNSLLYWYWDVCPSPGSPGNASAAAYVTIVQILSQSIHDFLTEKSRDGVLLQHPDFLLLARNEEGGAVFPGGVRLNSRLETLLRRVSFGGEFAAERIHWNGTTYLALAGPGRNLQGCALGALYPESRIDREIQVMALVIGGFMVLGLACAGAIGYLVSGLLLRPIRELSLGLTALRARDTTFRVRSFQADELGSLAEAFNRMMEDLKEMELARVIQEALLPSAFPPIPGYAGCVSSRCASRLGGDYCDVLPLKNGQILIVIGDVTGHGVGAALLMAMMKAAIFQYTENPGPLADLLLTLNDLVFHTMKKHMLVTFCAILLDPQEHRLQIANAGHPFPYILRRTGSVEEVVLPAVPLGSQIRRRLVSVSECALEPGDGVILYTDGYYEALDAAGEAFGYERFKDSFARLNRATPEEIRDRTLAVAQAFHPQADLDDDCTLVILKREESPA